MGTHIIDTHDDHVVDEVWSLYKYVVHQAGRTPNTMVEWDGNIPEWDVLYAELAKAKVAALDAKNYAPLPELARQETPYVANAITPLSDAQSVMQGAILSGDDSKPDEWVRAKADFAPAKQLAVYVNAYRYRLYDVTAEDYPVLKYYLGKVKFEQLLNDFVNSTHSEHFNVGHFATKLPRFLAEHNAYDSFALELCILETALSQLADSEETIPLETAHLEGMTAETLMQSKLFPREALELLSFNHPVNDYYLAVMEEKTIPPVTYAKTYLAVFRHNDTMWRMPLGGR